MISLIRELKRYAGAWALVFGAGLAMASDRNVLAFIFCAAALVMRRIEEKHR